MAAIALLLGGLLGACDNPVENDDEHPEVEVAGLFLLNEGAEIVRVEDGAVDDTLVVPLDGSIDVEVGFLDEDGREIHAEDLEEGLALAWEIRGEPLVTVQSAGEWSFTVEGDEAGETAMRIMLMHGDHSDLMTPDIPVEVR